MRHHHLFAWLLIALAFVPAWAGADHPKPQIYTWSVVPQFSPTAVHRDWTPLLDYLQKKTGQRFRLVTADSFDFFEGNLYQGRFDFAYANPYQTLLAHRFQGYLPLVRDGRSRLTGILVVRRGSPITDLQQLEGKKIAFAAPNAFAVSLYMRALLSERFGLHFEPVYVGTHSNAYRQVLLGRVPACGGVYRTLHKERPEVQASLRVIYEAPSTITHAVMAHPRVPEPVREAVRQAILDLRQTEQGRRLLASVFLPEPVAADFERDYKPLEALNLDKYVVVPEVP